MSRTRHSSGGGTDRGRGSSGSSAPPPPSPFGEADGSLSVSVLERIVEICAEFEDLWHCGEGPRIEEYLGRLAEPERSERLSALLAVELELRFRSGESADLEEYLGRFPEDAVRVREVFERVREDDGRTLSESRSDADAADLWSGRSSTPSAGSVADGAATFDGPPHARRGGGWGDEDEPLTITPEDTPKDRRDRELRGDIPTLSGISSADLTFVLGQAEVLDAVGEGGAPGPGPVVGEEAAATPGEATSPRPRTTPEKYGPPAQRTGRFTLTRLIDSGMFGDVYLARDDVLHRQVALKFPRLGASVSSARVEAFLIEARNAAQLRHPGIVAVHDVVERRGEGGIFVVMEFVDGSTLRDLLRTQRFPPERAAALLAEVADAVHYAHGRGFIHRDLKPANLLIDELGRPHVVDFGLAVHERALGDHAGEVAGTIPYMAPEQIRGVAHRIDGRTDIWALGVILYEMLTGTRPFPSERHKASNEIIFCNPRPPRDIDPSIPEELERICLRCLSKRMGERYASADELAGELRRWLAGRDPSGFLAAAGPGSGSASGSASGSGSGDYPALRSADWARLARGGPELARVVPKGLRAFSTEDAPFFLDLLPGPRDRNALPECARFWKTRIDSTDRETAFPVGLIFGPPGCGKSSLVHAGILPRLAPHVLTVSVAMTRDGAEAELLRRVRHRCPGLPGSLGLAESIRALREGTALPPGKKLLIVLDQFGQWLQANSAPEGSALVEALRQCDGGRVQALIVVRDEFWKALNRLLPTLDVELSTGRNMAVVGPFDLRHARAVLAAFGRGHGALPEDPEALSDEQRRFLDRAVEGLAEGGRVSCFRLALLAETVKDRPWTPATLQQIGGIRGMGVAYLEGALGARAQHPTVRAHRAAARAVLRALLPPVGHDRSGRVRSARELIEAAGHADRPREFEAILRVLDGELRLITPTEPADLPGPPHPDSVGPGPHYRLAHNSLAPAIREWLERRRRGSRRGRARIQLDLLASLWADRPQPRFLPSLREWISIRRHTRPDEWTPAERALMHAAEARLAWKALAAAALLAIALGSAMLRRRGGEARGQIPQALRAAGLHGRMDDQG